jgi:hypothetical protein
MRVHIQYLFYKRSFTSGITSASISAMTVSADIANLKLVLQNHVISLGTRSNDLLAASYTKHLVSKSNSTSTSGVNLSVFVNRVGSDVLVNGGVSKWWC